MDELFNPETDERLVLYVCMIPVWHARGSIGGSAFIIASQRLDGEKKVEEYIFIFYLIACLSSYLFFII